jgi:hypothetical protein
MRTEVMLKLDYVGRYAARDVICEEMNVHESQVTPRKPRTMPDRGGTRTAEIIL